MRGKSVSICNRSLARLVDSSKKRAFYRGYPNLMHSYGGLLVPRGPKLALLKSTLNAKNFIRRLSWLSSVISTQFTLKMCVAASNREKKITKTPFWGSRSSMLVPLESSSAVLVMISIKSVSICNRFHARWANSGKITISKGGTPLWCPRSRGISSPSGTKLPHKKLETLGYHMVKTRSLYLTWAWFGTG